MYLVIDIKDGDEFESEFSSLDAAMTEAHYEWSLLTYAERNKREEFFIAERRSDDPNDVEYFNYDVIKDFKKEWEEMK